MKDLPVALGIIMISMLFCGCGEKQGAEFPISLDFLEGTWLIDGTREAKILRDEGHILNDAAADSISTGWVQFTEGLIRIGSEDSEDPIEVKIERIDGTKEKISFTVENPNTKRTGNISIVALDSDTIQVLTDFQKGHAQQFFRQK